MPTRKQRVGRERRGGKFILPLVEEPAQTLLSLERTAAHVRVELVVSPRAAEVAFAGATTMGLLDNARVTRRLAASESRTVRDEVASFVRQRRRCLDGTQARSVWARQLDIARFFRLSASTAPARRNRTTTSMQRSGGRDTPVEVLVIRTEFAGARSQGETDGLLSTAIGSTRKASWSSRPASTTSYSAAGRAD